MKAHISSENLRRMPLGLLKKRAFNLTAECKHCGAYQPVYFSDMLEQHGETAILDDAIAHAVCLFCKQENNLLVTCQHK